MTQTIRERAERLAKTIVGELFTEDADLIEAFALAVRNEALDEAATAFNIRHQADNHDIGALITYKQVAQFLCALKTHEREEK